MTFTPIGAGQAQAWRICLSLKKAYTFWTADQPGGTPYLKWKDFDHRDAMYLLCDLWKMPKEA